MTQQTERFYGFFTLTGKNGHKSVQVVDSSSRNGFATEKTARQKLNNWVDERNIRMRLSVAVATHVCAFESPDAMRRYLAEANYLVHDAA